MTHVMLVLPVVVAAAAGLGGPAVSRRLPPRHATWLLSAGGALAALAAAAVLALLGSLVIGEQPAVAQEGHWSVAALRDHAPVDSVVASAALVAALVVGTAAVVAAVRRARGVLEAYRSCRDLPSAAGELVVVSSPEAGAYAVPGRPGRIVVARQLLAELSAEHRRALLAHERAHLRRGHHWHLTVVALAAAVNPLLTPLRSATRHAVERWADEDAADDVGDRRVVASALAAAALFLGPRPAAELTATTGAVHARIEALLAPPPGSRPGLLALTTVLLVAGAACALIAGKEIEHLFELAMHVQSRGG